MDSDDQDQSDSTEADDFLRFGPPRMGSPFEPSRLGFSFGRKRSKQPTSAIEPPIESAPPNTTPQPEPPHTEPVSEPVTAEVPPPFMSEPVLPPHNDQPDHLVAPEISEPQPESDLKQEEAAADVVEDDVQVEAESPVEAESAVEADFEIEFQSEVLEGVDTADTIEVETAEAAEAAEGAVEDEGSDLEEPEADVIQIASYVESDEVESVDTEDDAVESEESVVDAEVIDLTYTDVQAEAPEIPEAEADEAHAEVIDLEIEESNVINLTAPQIGSTISHLPTFGHRLEAETADEAIEAEAEPEPSVEADAETEPESDDLPVVPMFSVGSAIELLDSTAEDADETDELLDSEETGVSDGHIDQAVDEDAVSSDSDSSLHGDDRGEAVDEDAVSSDSDSSLDGEDADEDMVVAEATADEVVSDEPDIPGMPTLDDLRTMALDLDDIDSVLERLDADPDSIDLDVPPVEQTLDLSLSE